jgi:hypothetical protein
MHIWFIPLLVPSPRLKFHFIEFPFPFGQVWCNCSIILILIHAYDFMKFSNQFPKSMVYSGWECCMGMKQINH